MGTRQLELIAPITRGRPSRALVTRGEGRILHVGYSVGCAPDNHHAGALAQRHARVREQDRASMRTQLLVGHRGPRAYISRRRHVRSGSRTVDAVTSTWIPIISYTWTSRSAILGGVGDSWGKASLGDWLVTRGGGGGRPGERFSKGLVQSGRDAVA